MKKLLFFLSFITLSFIGSATDRYISPTGNNSNAGTLAAPWKTLSYAGANTVSGDIIHVLAGTYNETAQCVLKTGVSIVGVGVTSNIVYTYTGDCISLTSNTDGTNGNQSISNIKLDGSNLTGGTAIIVVARSNVKIYDCTIQNFLKNGVILNGSNNFGQPAVYMTGCELYNCIITNNSDRNYGQGNIVATGYRGILIHDNIITQTVRPIGHNGNIMSATTAGYSEGLKFYNNRSYRNADEGAEWAFHLELWDSQGNMEVYGNEFHGGNQMIDWGGSDSPTLGILPGVYAYAASVHDNLFQFDAPVTTAPQFQDVAVNLEGNVDKVLIYNNHFKNCPYGVQMTLEHSANGQKNITINNNLFENGGYVNVEWGFDIDILTRCCGVASTASNITIINNTFITNSLAALFVYSNPNSNVNNVTFTNNIVQGVRSYGYMAFDNGGGGVKSNFSVRNNNLYQNANSNAVSLLNGSTLPTSSTFTGNIIGNPLLDASFYLTASSPGINAGVNVGLPFCGVAPDDGWKEYCPSSTPPVANAGVDQTITLPVSNVTLSGTATTSGNIIAWNWQSVGTGSPVIGTPNAQTTGASGLVAGTYLFMLTVTDNQGLTDTDTMQVTVNAAAATAPTCSAGTTPVTITLPVNSVALTGTGASTAGNTVSYLWSLIVGSGGSITNPIIASTTATGLTAGSRTYRLTVTDNGNALTCTSDKVVITNAALIVPTANAGANQGITLPTNSVVLSGSGSGGTINSYLWTKLNGVGGTIANPTSASTNFTGLVSGTYDMELKVGNTDGNFGRDTMTVFVFPAPTAPSCSAGASPVTITLPTSTVALTGTGSSNSGNTVSYLWSLIVGSGGSITNPIIASTTATGLTAGSRTYRLTVTDNGNALTCTSDKVVITNAALIIPTANAGANQTITLPTNSVSLSGSGSGGTINSYLWTKISGIGGTLSAPTSANTNFTGLVAGVYSLQLRVGNTDGNFGYDTVQITVNPAIVLPTANAGADATIQLPTNIVALNGVGTGTQVPLTYLWTKLIGTGGSITSSTSALTQATGLTVGSYTYEFKVTDNNGNIARDTMTVTVLQQFQPPTVNAGADQTITLPTTIATLTGTYVLAQSTVSSLTWTQTSGAAATITSPSTASTTITGLAAGTYVFTFTVVTADGWTVSDALTITVSEVTTLPGFKWFNASLINGKANLSWRYDGATWGTYFTVQKKSWWWFNNIATVGVTEGVSDYKFIDNNTNKGNNTYRIKYGNSYSQNITVKKN